MGGTGGQCFCGHPPVMHAIRPVLPPRGPCVESGCPRFNAVYLSHTFLCYVLITTHPQTVVLPSDAGRTPCDRASCGRPYISHLLLEASVPGPPVVPSASTHPPPTAYVRLHSSVRCFAYLILDCLLSPHVLPLRIKLSGVSHQRPTSLLRLIAALELFITVHGVQR